jgi:cytochrome c-type biogenesis protein CcmH
MKSLIIAVFFLTFSVNAWETDTYVFNDEVTEIRYKTLVKELRCPKCQNQNLADSNSPIATDLRREVFQLLERGKSDGEIINFMVQRYGEFVLYRPQVSSLTYVLWFGPALLLFIGVIVVVQILRKKPIKKEAVILSEEQKSKLAQILKDK